MYPVKFEGYQREIGAPKGVYNCGSMPIHQDGEGIIFAWKATPEDLEQINRTGIIYGKTCSGSQVYMMYLTAYNPLRKRIFYKTEQNKVTMLFLSEEGLTPPIQFTYGVDTYKLDTSIPPIVDQEYCVRDRDFLLRRLPLDIIQTGGPVNEYVCMRSIDQDLFAADCVF